MIAVVKIGTSSITDEGGAIASAAVEKLCRGVATCRTQGHQVVVVTHLAPLEVSPAAKRAFWDRADRIVERARAGG